MLFGTVFCTSGETGIGAFFGISGDICGFGVLGGAFSAAAALALPLMENDILFFAFSISAFFSGSALVTTLVGVGVAAGLSTIEVFRFLRALSSSALKSAGGLNGLSSSSGSLPAQQQTQILPDPSPYHWIGPDCHLLHHHQESKKDSQNALYHLSVRVHRVEQVEITTHVRTDRLGGSVNRHIALPVEVGSMGRLVEMIVECKGKEIVVADIHASVSQRVSHAKKAGSFDDHVACEMEGSRRSEDRRVDLDYNMSTSRSGSSLRGSSGFLAARTSALSFTGAARSCLVRLAVQTLSAVLFGDSTRWRARPVRPRFWVWRASPAW